MTANFDFESGSPGLGKLPRFPIDHAKGLNAEIMNLALGIVVLPPDLEEAVQEIMPTVRKSFDRAVSEWTETKGGGE